MIHHVVRSNLHVIKIIILYPVIFPQIIIQNNLNQNTVLYNNKLSYLYPVHYPLQPKTQIRRPLNEILFSRQDIGVGT